MSWTPKNYEIKFVVCPRCSAYMRLVVSQITKHGAVITYKCDCGYNLDLISPKQNKKD